MYYPYLRAKQFELKALREFSEEHSGSNIVPIGACEETVCRLGTCCWGYDGEQDAICLGSEPYRWRL